MSKDNKGWLVPLDQLDLPEPKEPVVMTVLLDQQALQELLEQLEKLVQRDPQALRELPDSLVMLEFLAQQDQPVTLDLREQPDSPELQALRDRLELQEGLEEQAPLALQGHKA